MKKISRCNGSRCWWEIWDPNHPLKSGLAVERSGERGLKKSSGAREEWWAGLP